MTYEECLKIFGIRDVQDLPRAALEVVLGEEERRHDVYRELLRVNNYDVGQDWFQEIYEAEMSEGKRKGQHFTPPEIYRLVPMLVGDGNGEVTSDPTENGGGTDGVRRVHEPTAGTGGLIIGGCCLRTVIFLRNKLYQYGSERNHKRRLQTVVQLVRTGRDI